MKPKHNIQEKIKFYLKAWRKPYPFSIKIETFQNYDQLETCGIDHGIKIGSITSTYF